MKSIIHKEIYNRINMKRITSIFMTFTLLVACIIVTPQRVYATCYSEPSDATFHVAYNNNGTIASIQVDFAFYDSKYTEAYAKGTTVERYLNIVFTEDADKVNSTTDSTSPADNWNKLGNTICSNSAAKNVTCTLTDLKYIPAFGNSVRLMEGTFTLDDSTFLNSLDPNKTYYALLMASWTTGSSGGTYYTSAHTTIDLAAYRHSVTFDYQGHGTNFVLPVKNAVSVNSAASSSNPDYTDSSIISSSIKNIIDNWETTVTNPKVTGYDFRGWYTNSSCTTGNKAIFSNAIDSSVTYYAKWTPHTHVLTTLMLSEDITKDSCACGFYVIKYE